MSQPDYIETIKIAGYNHEKEITNLPDIFLVQGSRDCVIKKDEEISSRKGYTLVGGPKTKNSGHVNSYDWETNRNSTRSLRLNTEGELEVYFNSNWILLKKFIAGTRCNFTQWWDSSELIDVLLFTSKTADVNMWSGGITEVASATATTITIKGYLSGITYSFNSNGSITDSASGFITAGFAVNDPIIISGSASNDGTYKIKSITAGFITLFPNDILTNEASGATIVITNRVQSTWANQGFLKAGTRKIQINGIEYAYTGGENTGKLTGLVNLPIITLNDVCMQAVRVSSPAGLAGFTLDLISVLNNYVFYGDLTNRSIQMSTDKDYTLFTEAVPRIEGNGTEITIDSTPTAFIPGPAGDEFYISGRKDSWYKITFKVNSSLTGEEIRVRKLPTATGQAAQSQASIISIKNSTAFITFEPTLDTLSRITAVDTPQSKELSYAIKKDMISYDLTDANGIFYQNQIFIAIPKEGLVIIYDIEQGLWQPPHNLPIGRLALIDIAGDGTQTLCGHSNVSNETYRLYDGYNDNGAPIHVEMHFGYSDYGTRFTPKQFDEIATEIYMSENTNVTNKIIYDYKGSTSVKQFELRGDDTATRFKPTSAGGLGLVPLGYGPLGSLGTPVDDLSKFRIVDVTSVNDFFEVQRVFIANGIDIRFAIISTGLNVILSDDIPSYLKR